MSPLLELLIRRLGLVSSLAQIQDVNMKINTRDECLEEIGYQSSLQRYWRGDDYQTTVDYCAHTLHLVEDMLTRGSDHERTVLLKHLGYFKDGLERLKSTYYNRPDCLRQLRLLGEHCDRIVA